MLLSIISIGYWILYFEAINYRTGAENNVDITIAVIGVFDRCGTGPAGCRQRFCNRWRYHADLWRLRIPFSGSDLPCRRHIPPGVHVHLLQKRRCVRNHGPTSWQPMCFCSFFLVLFLERSGAQRFFIDFPLAAVGHKIGGPAKVGRHRLRSFRVHFGQRHRQHGFPPEPLPFP